jgi:SNF2 family DNA or RNA helicase
MTRRIYNPSEGQLRIGEHLAEHERCAVFASMGLGKTSSTLSHLEALYSLGIETEPTLVIAPLRVAQSTWPDECRKWDHLSGMDVVPIIGNAAQRAMALRTDAPIMTINYENLPWLVDWFKHNPRPWPFGSVVADESTKLKSTRISTQVSKKGNEFLKKTGGSVRGRALAEVAHKKVRRWINLTGTPAPNGLKDLWGQTWFLDGGTRLGRNFTSFQNRWFQAVPGGGAGYTQIKPLDHAQDEIQAKLRDICLSLNAADYFDIKEPIVRRIYVDLPAPARRLYQDMEKRMYMEIGEHEIEAVNAASRTIKCLQLANGAAYVDDSGNWKEVHDAKLQALEDIVEEASGMPVLVAYHFKSDLARLTRAFPRGRVLDANPQTIRDWNAGRIPVLFAHPASAGHGLNLQDGGNIVAFFGHWWNLEEFQQIIERIGPTRQLQAGYKRPVFIYHIIARDTVDEDVMLRRETKREVQDILLEAMKRKRVV